MAKMFLMALPIAPTALTTEASFPMNRISEFSTKLRMPTGLKATNDFAFDRLIA